MVSCIERIQLSLLCFIIFCALSVGTFPLPFLAEYLNDSGYDNLQVGIAFSSYGIGALFGYAVCLFHQVFIGDAAVSSPKKWMLMAGAQLVTAISGLVLTFDAHYTSFIATRFFQGVASAVSWTYGISLANKLSRTSLGGCFGKTEAAAFVMAVGIIGEACGPWLGTFFFDQFYDSVSLPYAMVTSFAGLNAILATIMAWSRHAAADFETMTSSHHGNGSSGNSNSNAPEGIAFDALRRSQPTPSSSLLHHNNSNGSSSSGAGLDREWTRPLSARGRWAPLVFLLKDSQFRHLSLLLLTSSIPRSLLVFLLPVFTDESLHTSAEQNATIYGVACVFLLFGALLAGRFVHRQGNPMPFVLIITIIYSVISCFVFYGDDVYSAGFTYCCFCALLIFANVVVIHQLELFATSIRGRDQGVSDRVISLACLLWTIGWNGGSIIAGITEDEEDQRIVVIIGSCITAVYAMFLLTVYGCPKRGRPAAQPTRPPSSSSHSGYSNSNSSGTAAAVAASLGRPIPSSSSSSSPSSPPRITISNGHSNSNSNDSGKNGAVSPNGTWRSFSPNATPSTPSSFVRQPSASQLLR